MTNKQIRTHQCYCVKQILTDLKRYIDNRKKVFGVFNTQLSTVNRSPREYVSEGVLNLNYTLDQMDSTGKNIAVHPIAAKFFSTAH